MKKIKFKTPKSALLISYEGADHGTVVYLVGAGGDGVPYFEAIPSDALAFRSKKSALKAFTKCIKRGPAGRYCVIANAWTAAEAVLHECDVTE